MNKIAWCPHPPEFQEKAARLGWAGWIPTPGVADEDKDLYVTLGERNVYIMSIEDALALSDEELQQRIEAAMGMTVDQASEQYGVNPDEVPGGVRYPKHDILPKGTELTPGRELAFDLPIVIERDRG